MCSAFTQAKYGSQNALDSPIVVVVRWRKIWTKGLLKTITIVELALYAQSEANLSSCTSEHTRQTHINTHTKRSEAVNKP